MHQWECYMSELKKIESDIAKCEEYKKNCIQQLSLTSEELCQSTIKYLVSWVDDYVNSLLKSDAEQIDALSDQKIRGLKDHINDIKDQYQERVNKVFNSDFFVHNSNTDIYYHPASTEKYQKIIKTFEKSFYQGIREFKGDLGGVLISFNVDVKKEGQTSCWENKNSKFSWAIGMDTTPIDNDFKTYENLFKKLSENNGKLDSFKSKLTEARVKNRWNSL